MFHRMAAGKIQEDTGACRTQLAPAPLFEPPGPLVELPGPGPGPGPGPLLVEVVSWEG